MSENCSMQNVYANMDGNVMVHIAIPALGMVATHWAVVCWSKSQIRRESLYDLKYIYRCVPLKGPFGEGCLLWELVEENLQRRLILLLYINAL